jgi:polyphosphate:AMP phosphotransferase
MAESKDTRIDTLRDRLLTAQAALTRDKSFAVAVIVTGMPTAGRSEVVNKLLEWFDPKHVSVHALDKLPQASRSKPPMQRFWLTLPARGEIAIYFNGWYDDLLVTAMHSPKKAKRTEQRGVERVRRLEAMLTSDRIRIVKLELRVERRIQKKRIEELRADKATRWRVTKDDRWLAKHYDLARDVLNRIVAATDTSSAPWRIVDGKDPQARLYHAGSHVLKALSASAALTPARVASRPIDARALRKAFKTKASTSVDESYDKELESLQGRLALLSRKDEFAKRSAVLAFEGMDAAGKGGSIRRLTAALDARQFTVVPISAPSAEELAHPYLWRFWHRIPERGDFTIFDRSWYGRVLVERVRDLAPDPDWQRAYDEINEFERQLAESKIIVHKFWLSIGKNEQLQRFEEREKDALKRFKVDREDWANRRFYDDYQRAAQEMIARTSTEWAPWTVIEADDKKFARLKVLRTVCEALEGALKKSS